MAESVRDIAERLPWPHRAECEERRFRLGNGECICPWRREYVKAIEAAIREARRQGREEAARSLEAEADEIAACANSYDRDDLGDPRRHLLTEAGHYRKAAAKVRNLPLEGPGEEGR